ncbi:enoyl-CoA hydratase/isomerase family protein [Microbacterium sp. A196]|uniref:enoyl-CoA hydratase/isomerase family protein n=1 Tax=unclassified Microbacterium TaxID=2609290 RepID=UPI003F389EBE
MNEPALTVDERLALLAAGHFDAAQVVPAILDVTNADPAAVLAIRTLPAITYERVAEEIPPRQSETADLAVPASSADALVTAVNRNPVASVVLTQLVRATAALPIDDALAMESISYSALQAGQEYQTWLSRRRAPEPAGDPSPRIRIEADVEAVTIWLDRPLHANALDTRARHELVEALTGLRYDESRIILRGVGPHFCAGGDLEEFSAPTDVTETHRVRLRQGLAATVAHLGARLDAHVHGAVIGAGLELSAFADRIIARPDARFRLPEVRMGLLPGSGGTVSVPRRIGANRALVLMLTGRVLDAERALAWGLIDEIAR